MTTPNPVAQLRRCKDGEHEYDQLWFVCPGCATRGFSGLHAIPVGKNPGAKRPFWSYDGNIEQPTLAPSILTKMEPGFVCHSFLRAGVFEFLGDCTHRYAGQKVRMGSLPDWFLRDE